MLAQRVETQPFHHQDIVGIAFRRCRCENPVGPVALIQQTVKEIGLAVEAQAGIFAGFLDLQRTDCKIGFDPVLPCLDSKIVQIRVFRAPQPGLFRGNGNTAVYQFKTAESRHGHGAAECRLDGNRHTVAAVFDMQFFDVFFGNALQPDCLPDAGNRGVPHTAPL